MGSIAPEERDTVAMESFLKNLPSQHLEPLWSKMNVMVPPVPAPVAKPHIWRYNETLPHLMKAGEMVPAEQAERRVLMLVNPTMKSPFTTDTIYGGLQLVNPNETAPAHRHIAFAARVIIDGEGFTAVEGKKMPLRRGDVITTPTWHWHDHGNESNRPVIWLDALNLPLFTYFPAHFAEQYQESRYPSTPCDPSPWRFPWGPVEEALNAKEGPYAVHHYVDANGKSLSTTLTAQAERIDANQTSPESQESCSFLYHVYEGKGKTILTPPSGEETVIEWTTRDTFAVPAWSKIQHVNESGEKAYLIAVSDRPFIELLGLARPKA